MDVNDSSILHHYTENGDLESISTFIENKSVNDINIEAPDLDSNTLLHVASAYNHTSLVGFLIENGANINATNSLRWTPLMQAARYGHSKAVKILIAAGADVHVRNHFGLTALMLACASDDIDTVRAILDVDGKISDASDLNHCLSSNLMIAAIYGNNSVVRLLLDKGCSANVSVPEKGVTPLMCAAVGGTLSTAEILLERGAKTDAANVADYTAADIASICNNTSIANKLKLGPSVTRKTKDKVLKDIMEATKEGNLQAVQEILVNDPSKAKTTTLEGATPLMVAAMLGNIPIAQVLIYYGADINAQDFVNEWTPLMQAVYHRQTAMAKFLIEEGADVFKKVSKGYNVFDLANENYDMETLRAIVEFQNNSLSQNESNSSSTSPTFQYMKQLWGRISSTPESVPKGRDSTSFFVTPFSLPNPEPVLHIDEPVIKGNSFTTAFDEMNRIVEETRLRVKPPLIRPLKQANLPGSTVDMSNNFTNYHLIQKFKKLDSRHQQSNTSGAATTRTARASIPGPSSVKVPDIKVTFDTSHIASKTFLRSLSIPQSLLWECTDGSDRSVNLITDSFTRELESLSMTLEPNNLWKLLSKLGMKHHSAVLQEQEIDAETFLMLNPSDLKELGIESPHEVKLIMSAIKRMRDIINIK